MSQSISAALSILSHFWLAEVQPNDVATIAALPELAETLPQTDQTALTELAIEYQRLFGFNLPPYESVFSDPTAMLLAPATARVQALYRQADWSPPADARAGAPDHLGLELLALAEIEAEAEGKRLAQQLHTQHLALWAPAFILSLRRLTPHPFYAALADLTLDLLLTTLPDHSQFTINPLPLPPLYNDQGQIIPLEERVPETGLQALVRRLLTPCESGLFLTREDIARMARLLDLPGVMGDRAHMLETLFRSAGAYDLAPALVGRLGQLLTDVDTAYQGWAEAYPAWTPYAEAWRSRINTTQSFLTAPFNV